MLAVLHLLGFNCETFYESAGDLVMGGRGGGGSSQVAKSGGHVRIKTVVVQLYIFHNGEQTVDGFLFILSRFSHVKCTGRPITGWYNVIDP